MSDQPDLCIGDTCLRKAIVDMLSILASTIPSEINEPIRAYVAGGAAAYLYTAQRMSSDLDVEFSKRLIIPPDLLVVYKDEQGEDRSLEFDRQYNSTFALMHEDYTKDAIMLKDANSDPRIQIFVLSPIDLAVSKLSRFNDNDKADIGALADAGLISSEALEQRSEEAIGGYIGNSDFLRCNIRDALKIIRAIEAPYSKNGNEQGSD